MSRRPPASVDVIVIGGGLVGAASAVACADRGLSVVLIHRTRPGTATTAGAGMLAPSVEKAEGAAHAFALAARDRWPSFGAALEARTGLRVPINRLGILDLVLDPADEERKRAHAGSGHVWFDADKLRRHDPGYAGAIGAVFHPDDGAADHVAAWDALWRVIEDERRIAWLDDLALRLEPAADGIAVVTNTGERMAAAHVVAAGGAWAGELAGLPRRVPGEPVRGQMLAYKGALVRHVAYGPGGYVVPRADGETWIGATMERVGFASDTTPQGRAQLADVARRLVPSLDGAAPLRHWAGLRPVSPDMLPLLGPDPALPRLIHASGHSRNGILEAPLTADVVAALVAGADPGHDLTPFRPDRFANHQ